MTKYPEHEKLQLVQEKTQGINDFLDWIGEKGMRLAVWTERGEFMEAAQFSRSQLLAEWSGIDMQKIAEEKTAMLDDLRRGHDKG